jgi:hypothetical protein
MKNLACNSKTLSDGAVKSHDFREQRFPAIRICRVSLQVWNTKGGSRWTSGQSEENDTILIG